MKAACPKFIARLVATVVVLGCTALLQAGADWAAIVAKARGQTVYWNAWGGEDLVNAYIQWVGQTMRHDYGVELKHVRLTDTGEAVTRVLAEKAAGRKEKGSVDVIWVNGENFAALKQNGLLYGPFTQDLPNFRLVDTVGKPTLKDFTVPVEGLEAPWSMAQFVFLYDTERIKEPPRNPRALLAWAKAHPGRFTYPQPPDFLGTTFLKQTLLSLAGNGDAFRGPVSDEEFTRLTAALWEYLDALHPVMWRQGRAFPANGPAQTRLLADGETDLALSFSIETASTAIMNGQLPATIRTFIYEGGTIGNASFLAIPFNSSAKEASMVLINFLLSPEAQARKQQPGEIGSQTVLAMDKLAPADRALFERIPRGPATLSPKELGTPLAEPHPFWMTRLEKEWGKRYGAGR
ncbi:MAG TPA: ABC transporter substrate-binding protein [Verrucomicrobiae bacterium]|nr:ABC transporter substrate-binding protein [Verrucomicrobiae bacterium]